MCLTSPRYRHHNEGKFGTSRIYDYGDAPLESLMSVYHSRYMDFYIKHFCCGRQKGNAERPFTGFVATKFNTYSIH